MKRSMIILLSVIITLVIPLSGANKSVYTCDTCHSQTPIYRKHLEVSCSRCHKEDVHVLHNFSCESCHNVKPFVILCHGAQSYANIPECRDCHENLIETHKNDCRACHREEVNEIHWPAIEKRLTR